MAITPQFIGQTYEDTLTGDIYRANSLTEGDWTLICSPGSGGGTNVEGAGDPNVVTPDFVGQVYKDTDTGNLWRSNSTTIGDWTLELQNAQMQWTPHSFQLANILKLSLVGNTTATAWDLQMETSGGINIEEDFTLQSLTSTTLTAIDQTINAALTVDNCDVLSLISLSALTSITDQISVSNCPLMNEIAVDQLNTVPIFNLDTLPQLVTLGLDSLSTISSMTITACDILSSIPVTNLATAGAFNIHDNASLTEILLISWVPTNGSSYTFSNNALDAATINLILAQGVANAGFVTGAMVMDGGTNAAPSGQGIVDKATLQGRGVTVTTN